jgi:autophagy-related protein 11
MSLHVIVAHTGERLDADPVSITSLDNLRSWVSQVTTIPAQDQILLTSKGKHVKLQALLTEVRNPNSSHRGDDHRPSDGTAKPC